MTYSIVARDPETGALGVAVQSHYFAAGGVAWAEAGVGAVATQATADPSYGPLGLELMRAGKSPRAALDALTAADDGAAIRQVAMLDARGDVAAHTGERCIAHAAHRTAEGVSVQANMMERDTVPGAMLSAYASATGTFADRLLAALDAAEAEGGDIRGRQAAGILIVTGTPTGRSWRDRLVDLRVDDHPEPNAELRRLVALHAMYNGGGRRSGSTIADDALRRYADTVSITRGNPELLFWEALAVARRGDVDSARMMLTRCAEVDARWLELVRRLPDAGLLPREVAESLDVSA